MRATTFGIVAIALSVSVGCGASSSKTGSRRSTTSSIPSTTRAIPGCVPACRRGLARPGKIPAGEYQTKWFFGGTMTLTLDGGWSVHEDSSGEFALTRDGTRDDTMLFWLDVYPVSRAQRVANVPLTTQGLLDWLQTAPPLDTSNIRSGAIGDLPATVVDVRVNVAGANAAVDEALQADCPARPCVDLLGFPQWELAFGITATQVLRVYLVDVKYGGATHLFVAAIYPDRARDLENFATVSGTAIKTVRVPVA